MSGNLREKLKVKINSFRPRDMLNFKNLPLRRDKAIEAAKDSDIITKFPINENAKALHPAIQDMVVRRITERPDSDARTILLEKADKSPAAWFRAGQYVSLKLDIGESHVTRPYSISSSPLLTKVGQIEIAVRRKKDGFASSYLMDTLKENDHIRISGPEGQFYHENLRDSENVIAVAGGSGITPFLSMAQAIRDGVEDFNLTILFGSRTEKSIMFKDELDQIQKATDKVKVIHVLSDENVSGFEHGFIDADLISRYAPGDYSLFVCGPEAMYRFIEKEIPKLGIPAERVRLEVQGGIRPEVDEIKTFRISVIQGPNRYEIFGRNDESILIAMERSGIIAPSRCRSGECGWCRSKIISGTFLIPEGCDKRRHMDKTTDHVHVCISYPTSDLVIEVPRGDC